MECLRKLTTTDWWLKPHTPSIDKVFWFWFALSCFANLVHFALDIQSLYHYASGGQWYLFRMLLVMILLSHVLISISSYLLFWTDRQYCDLLPVQIQHCFLIFLPIPMRMACVGKLACKISCRQRSKENEEDIGSHWYRLQLVQKNLSWLSLIAVYVCSAPQLVLKIYQLLKYFNSAETVHGDGRNMTLDVGAPLSPNKQQQTVHGDIAFHLISMVLLALSTVWLGVRRRQFRYDKDELSYASIMFQTLYRTFFLASRVLALACLFFLGLVPGIVVCVGAVVACFIWFRYMGTDCTETRTHELCYQFVMAYLHIFGMINVKDDPARYRYAIYYTLSFFVELGVYEAYMRTTGGEFTLLLFPGLFAIGLVCHAVEHELFHPGGWYYRPRDPAESEVQRQGSIPQVSPFVDLLSLQPNQPATPAVPLPSFEPLRRRSLRSVRRRSPRPARTFPP